MLSPIRTAAPTETPISLDEVKRHCRVTEPDEDSVFLGLIAAVTSVLDGWYGWMGRALITQSWALSFPCFGGGLRLPVGPVSDITSVTYYDGDNVSQTLNPNVYRILTDPLSSYIALEPGQTWPGYYGRADAVTVEWVAGEAVADLPAAIKLGMKLLVAHWYENREATVIGQTAMEIPLMIEHLLEPYRVRGPTFHTRSIADFPYSVLWPILD